MKKSILAICMLVATIFYGFPVFSDNIKILGSNRAQMMFYDVQPFVDQNNTTMLPLVHFDKIFKQGISYSVYDNRIIIKKEIFSIHDVITLKLGSNILLKNEEEIKMNTAPVIRNGNIFIPLKFVADALEYWIDYDEKLNAITIGNVIAEIYLWNEREDSSADGVRYSVLPGTVREKELAEIQQNPITDFNEVKKRLSWVKLDDKILTTVLYSARGYKVPKKAVDEVRYSSVYMISSLESRVTERCIDTISPLISNFTDWENNWYSGQLLALDEKNIKDYGGHTYRFTYIPAFWNPYTVRVNIRENGEGILHFAKCNGSVSFFGGELIQNIDLPLKKSETETILNILEQHGFWNLPTSDEAGGLDGEEWIMEGFRDGQYHIVDRWCPEEGDDLYGIGAYFIILASSIKYRLSNQFFMKGIWNGRGFYFEKILC